MLQSFTWQQFLVAALILSFIWYLFVLLVCCKGNLKSLFARRQKTPKDSEPLKHYWDNDNEYEEIQDDDDLLGKSKLPEGVSDLSMGSFGFVQNENEKDEKLGLVPDVIEELKGIFNILAKEDGNKDDFFSLLQLVKVKYPKIGASLWVKEINQYIQEHAPFHLTKEELDSLWD